MIEIYKHFWYFSNLPDFINLVTHKNNPPKDFYKKDILLLFDNQQGQ